MRLSTLVVGLLCCAFVVGAQELPVYDDIIYDEIIDAEAAPAPEQDVAALGAEGETVAEDPIAEDVVNVTTTTTTAAPTPRRKLVSLKSAKLNRQRPRVSQPKPREETPNEEVTVTEAPNSGTQPRRQSSLRGRGSSTRLRGRTSTQSNTETETVAEEEPAKTETRGRLRQSSSLKSQPETSSRFKPTRSFRPSSRSSKTDTATATEDETQASSSSSNRFRPSSRSGSRSFSRSPSRATTQDETVQEEPSNNHRFSAHRRGRGNSRGGSSFRPSRPRTQEPEVDAEAPVEEETTTASSRRTRLRSQRKFRGPNIRRKTPRISRPARKTTTTTTTTTTSTTTTTQAPTTTQPPTTTSPIITTHMPVKPFTTETDEPTLIEMNKDVMSSTVDMLKEEEFMMDEKVSFQDEIMPEDVTPQPQLEQDTAVDEVFPKEERTITNLRDIPVHEREEALDGVVLRPIPVRHSTEEPTTTTTPPTTTTTTPRPRRTTTTTPRPPPTTTTTPRPPPTRSSRRKSSRYTPPKAPSHPIVETTKAPVDIFAPPLSDAVKSRVRGSERDRVTTPSSRRVSPNDITNGPPTVAPSPTEAPVKSKFRRPNYGTSQIQYVGSNVKITEIGTVEDTPPEEVNRILSGLGSRRRGLGRPQARPTTQAPVTTSKPAPAAAADDYYYYYDYDYAY